MLSTSVRIWTDVRCRCGVGRAVIRRSMAARFRQPSESGGYHVNPDAVADAILHRLLESAQIPDRTSEMLVALQLLFGRTSTPRPDSPGAGSSPTIAAQRSRS